MVLNIQKGTLLESKDNLYVFYHLFTVKQWKEIFEYHLNAIVYSGLYNNCKKIKIGVVYKDIDDYRWAKWRISKYKKISIYYKRKYKDLPFVIWKKPLKRTWYQYGEAETILSMIRHSKHVKNNYIYMFFHSKGVTNPSFDKKGNIMPYFYDRGLSKGSSRIDKNNFILNDMTKELIYNWRERLKALAGKSFYYYIWNFFIINGALLKEFNINKYEKHINYKICKSRHSFAFLPMVLYEIVNGISVSEEYTNIENIGMIK